MCGSKSRFAALLLAGGGGTRFGSGCPKQYLKFSALNSKSSTRVVVERFLHGSLFCAIVVIVREQDMLLFTEATGALKDSVHYLYAQQFRHLSVFEGLKYLRPYKPDFVLVHDVARPFSSDSLIKRVMAKLCDGKVDIVIPVLRATDSMMEIKGDSYSYLDRNKIYKAQTPQGMRFKSALEGYQRCCGSDSKIFSDEGSLMDSCGFDLGWVEGDRDNIKVTFAEDIL